MPKKQKFNIRLGNGELEEVTGEFVDGTKFLTMFVYSRDVRKGVREYIVSEYSTGMRLNSGYATKKAVIAETLKYEADFNPQAFKSWEERRDYTLNTIQQNIERYGRANPELTSDPTPDTIQSTIENK